MFNTQVRFVNSSSNSVSYQWDMENGFPSGSNLINPNIEFPDGLPGEYDVQLIVTSEFGCLDTSNQTVIVYEEILLYAPNAFTPDGDEHNQTWRVFAEGIDQTSFELNVFNRWGELVWESHSITDSWDGRNNFNEIVDGMYTWTLKTKDMTNDAKYFYNGHVQILR